MEETELIRQCRKGNQKAQRELYEQFSDMLFRLAVRYVKDVAEAEDVVMVSFMNIFRSMEGFDQKHTGGLIAWMRRIVVNNSLMSLRKRHNFNLTETLDADLQTPDLSAFKEMEAEYIYQMILTLPVGYRTVFNLYVIEGYDHREIGNLLGISDSTSRTQLLKAKSLLKKKIEKEGYRYGT